MPTHEKPIVTVTMAGWTATTAQRRVRVMFVAEFQREDGASLMEAVDAVEDQIRSHGELIESRVFFPK